MDTGDAPTTKAGMRARIRAQRRADAGWGKAHRSATSAGLLDSALAAGLLDPERRPGHVGPVRIAAYVAATGEPDVGPIRAAVRAAGGAVLLPIPGPGRSLQWALDDGRYVPAPRLPVPMPAGDVVGAGVSCLIAHGVSVVLVPALAVDRGGVRLGQGGGFYDVLLAGLRDLVEEERPEVLAVVGEGEVLPAGTIPRDAHDMGVPGALTPGGVLRF